MCTLTFIPTSSGFLFTSNRDEKRLRSAALPPKEYALHGQSILFPKDGEAGGTWIASGKTLQLCLLNGAFEAHTPSTPYRLSRGIVLLDAFSYPSFSSFYESYSFQGIEPFTLIAVETYLEPTIWELRWDGKQVFLKALDATQPAIWSSSTLYSAAIRKKRELWFSDFLKEHPSPNQEAILAFHQFTGEGDKSIDLVMERSSVLQTLSISSLEYKSDSRKFCYLDLVEGNTFEENSANHA